MTEYATRLAAVISALDDELLLVITGAGVSAGSGIPTFRGSEPDALWKVSDVELATFDYFQRDPVAQWRWYLKRFESVETASPNPGHEALALLEGWQTDRGGSFQLVTQNIDTLHEAAGSSAIRLEHGFERHHRDVHVLTQHTSKSYARYEDVGKMLFGIPPTYFLLEL